MKVFKVLSFFLFCLLFFVILVPKIKADNIADITVAQNPLTAKTDDNNIKLTFTSTDFNFDSNNYYGLRLETPYTGNCYILNQNKKNLSQASNHEVSINIEILDLGSNGLGLVTGNKYGACSTKNTGLYRYEIWETTSQTKQKIYENYFEIYPASGKNFKLGMKGKQFKPDNPATVYIIGAVSNTYYGLWYEGETTSLFSGSSAGIMANDSNLGQMATAQINTGSIKTRRIICGAEVQLGWTGALNTPCQVKYEIFVVDNPQPAPDKIQTGDPINLVPPTPTPISPTPLPPPPPCKDFDDNGKCERIFTGLGNISTKPEGFIKSIFGIVLSLAGGIALILIIVSGYQMMTSQGNPEKLQGAKETLTSAVVGLLFIIFSMVILQVIGVDILKIPGFK